MDRKIDYLNQQGFIPFIEVARRDASMCWKKYYSWPESYARYIQYVWARYQANNCVFSPIHFDIDEDTIPASDYNDAVRVVMTKFGPPPYGTYAFGQFQSVHPGEFWRRLLGDSAPDGKRAGARLVLVPDGDLSVAESKARVEWRALLRRLQR